jgi:hypothetical protein
VPGPARDPEQFMTKVQILPSGCWAWMGRHLPNGYALCHRRGMKETLAHRVSYRLFTGPIPEPFTIDHLCRNRGCVNPAHLEAVPLIENVLRGFAPSVVRSRRGTCDRGHPFVLLKDGRHYCRACSTERSRERMGHTARIPAQCGTPSGYVKHRRRGEEACRPCKEASAAKQRAYRSAS